MAYTKNTDILVLGLGNLLLADEGAGPRVIRHLTTFYRFPACVELVDGGTMGMALLEWISNRSHIIIIDAIRTGNPPGTIQRIDDVPAFLSTRVSPHQIGLSDVLALSEMTGEFSANVVLFGIEPETLLTGLSLSDSVEKKVAVLAQLVVNEIETICKCRIDT